MSSLPDVEMRPEHFFLVGFSSLLMMTLWEQQTSLIRHVVHFGRGAERIQLCSRCNYEPIALSTLLFATRRMSIFSVVNYR